MLSSSCNFIIQKSNNQIPSNQNFFITFLIFVKDGILLPPPILFDVADEVGKLPSTQRVFVINADAQKIAGQFMEQYFAIFDSDNRQPLLDAYHEQACFSMTVSLNGQGNNKLVKLYPALKFFSLQFQTIFHYPVILSSIDLQTRRISTRKQKFKTCN